MYKRLIQKDFELSRELMTSKGIKRIKIKTEKWIIHLMIQ